MRDAHFPIEANVVDDVDVDSDDDDGCDVKVGDDDNTSLKN